MKRNLKKMSSKIEKPVRLNFQFQFDNRQCRAGLSTGSMILEIPRRCERDGIRETYSSTNGAGQFP